MTVNGSITTTTTYVAGGLEEITSNGVSTTLTKYFGGANGLPTAERVGTNGPLSYLASDGQGTVSEALDGGGNVTFAQLYTPYGTARYSSGSSPTTLGYTGQRVDGTTGLDYYHARYYDPVAGQFGSADTVNDGLNRYGYVHGNPTTATDPTGHRIVLDGDGPYSRSGRAPDPRLVTRYPWTLDWSHDGCYPKGCYDPGGRSKNSDEAKAGVKLATYFGVHVDRLDENDPSNAEFGYYGSRVHIADYDVYGSHTYLGPTQILTAQTPHYRVDYYKPTTAEWDNPDGAAQPGGIVRQVIKKGDEQASIVVVDVSKFDTQPSDAQFEEYGYRAVYAPYSGRSDPSHVARVIYMYNGQIVYDYNPLNYGPPEADHNAVPIIEN